MLDRCEAAKNILVRCNADIILREIDAGLEQRDQLEKLFLPWPQAAGNGSFDLLGGDTRLVEGRGFDEVANRLGLRQIDAAVDVGSQSKFAGFGQTGAFCAETLQAETEDDRSSMTG